MALVTITEDYYAVLEADVTATTEVTIKSYKRTNIGLSHESSLNTSLWRCGIVDLYH